MNNTAIKIYTLHSDGTETLRKVIPNKQKRSKYNDPCPCSTCIHDRPGEDKCAMGKVISIRPIGCKLKVGK